MSEASTKTTLTITEIRSGIETLQATLKARSETLEATPSAPILEAAKLASRRARMGKAFLVQVHFFNQQGFATTIHNIGAMASQWTPEQLLSACCEYYAKAIFEEAFAAYMDGVSTGVQVVVADHLTKLFGRDFAVKVHELVMAQGAPSHYSHAELFPTHLQPNHGG